MKRDNGGFGFFVFFFKTPPHSRSQGRGRGGGGVAVHPGMGEQGGYTRGISTSQLDWERGGGIPYASQRYICHRGASFLRQMDFDILGTGYPRGGVLAREYGRDVTGPGEAEGWCLRTWD